MVCLTRSLATAVAAVSLAFVAAYPATASPTPSPTPTTTAQPQKQASSVSGEHVYSFTTKGNVGEKITVTSKVWQKAGQKKGRFDWRAAKKYFGKHTTWRDDFAAGAQAGGATLDHASKSTKKRLRDRWNDMSSASAKIPLKAKAGGGGTNCKGVSKTVKWNGTRSEDWYDSCDTNTLKNHWYYCTGAMGFATFASPSFWKAIPIVFGLICGQNISDISTAQANSSVNAIKYYNYRIERQNSPSEGQYYIRATLYPQ